ncbi:hypothetical protein EVG20_g3363 [Dentipellis fragilis]|uniref:Uncharacterized protein n=1 Tax=Dentipellis fragilis TaxID=205917 RepID=A0A4Y9Z2R1_9AGAM|nr:hypothetical protein EVG20_g3363 [Dentipellis fragilis]
MTPEHPISRKPSTCPTASCDHRTRANRTISCAPRSVDVENPANPRTRELEPAAGQARRQIFKASRVP